MSFPSAHVIAAGFSRILTQQHDVIDVSFGFLLGGLGAVACLRFQSIFLGRKKSGVWSQE